MNSTLYIDDNGKAELYDDDYNITIFCKDEQEQQRAMKRLEVANRMRWHPVTRCDERPKNNKAYIVSIKWAIVRGKTVYRWKWPWDRIYSDGGIIRWAYLPQPPKKQEDATHGTVEPQC
jgi:hypothetical protein